MIASGTSDAGVTHPAPVQIAGAEVAAPPAIIRSHSQAVPAAGGCRRGRSGHRVPCTPPSNGPFDERDAQARSPVVDGGRAPLELSPQVYHVVVHRSDPSPPQHVHVTAPATMLRLAQRWVDPGSTTRRHGWRCSTRPSGSSRTVDPGALGTGRGRRHRREHPRRVLHLPLEVGVARRPGPALTSCSPRRSASCPPRTTPATTRWKLRCTSSGPWLSGTRRCSGSPSLRIGPISTSAPARERRQPRAFELARNRSTPRGSRQARRATRDRAPLSQRPLLGDGDHRAAHQRYLSARTPKRRGGKPSPAHRRVRGPPPPSTLALISVGFRGPDPHCWLCLDRQRPRGAPR